VDQDTLRSLLKEAVRETVTEVPAFLKPYARRLVDVGEVAVALYAAGVSQRKAAEVMSLLLGHRYAHETISAMTGEVLQAVAAFRQRPPARGHGLRLPGRAYPQGPEGGDRTGDGVRGPGGHAFRGAAGPGVLAIAHGERPGVGGGLAGALAKGLAAGVALHHRRATRAS